MTVNKQKNPGVLFCHVTSPVLWRRAHSSRASPLTVAVDSICPRVRSFTCHRHRLVSSPEHALSASMRHPSDAETGSRQTHGWNGGEMSTAPACRDARCARRGQDRGGDRSEEGTGPGRGQDRGGNRNQKKKKKQHFS